MDGEDRAVKVYSLVEKDGLYGDEAINTIVQEMENNREDIVVIFAGYPEPMERFLNKNPGLRSCIAFHVPFADYDTEELCGIARLMAKEKLLRLTDGAVEKLTSVFDAARMQDDFGNGRCVRNTLEQARMNQAARLLTIPFDAITDRELMTIRAEDIPLPPQIAPQARRIGFGALIYTEKSQPILSSSADFFLFFYSVSCAMDKNRALFCMILHISVLIDVIRNGSSQRIFTVIRKLRDRIN